MANHIYDLADWRPITPEHYLEELGACTLTIGEPNELKVVVETLDDERVRIVTHAEICTGRDDDGVPTGELGPYLMMLYSPEGGAVTKPKCFKRTTELALV